MKSSAVAVVVTLNPDIGILGRQLDNLSIQCPVIIVDNGSVPDILNPIRALCAADAGRKLTELSGNHGIAAAQNIGIRVVEREYPEHRYVLLLDHDSVPALDMSMNLQKMIEEKTNNGEKVAAAGPILFDPRSKAHLSNHVIRGGLWWKLQAKPGSGSIRVDSLNSSGSLISRVALNEVGLMDEALFIDHVETEWCFRAAQHSFRLYVDRGSVMEHTMGDDVVSVGGDLGMKMPYRSPRRHYAIVRNSIYLQRLSHVPLVWKFWNIIKLLFTFIYFGIFSQDAGNHRKWIRKGLQDGMSRKMGPIPESAD